MTLAAVPRTWSHRHLLDVDQLDRAQLEQCLDLAVELRSRRGSADLRELLAEEIVALAFYEPSTRTRISFELAAAAVGARTVDLNVAASSVEKGESLVDTMRTLERTGVTTAVLRHPASGAPYLVARQTGLRIVNAGDGIHAHPTQALADALTLREALGSLEGRKVAIVGDVTRSRVARSDIHAFRAFGAEVWVSGPPAFVTGFEDWPGVRVAPVDDALDDADAVLALRIQTERGTGGPGVREYVTGWGLTEERIARHAPRAWVMHPGPTNEGIEISAELANGPRSLIGRQVENGVPVRMAILALVAGRA